MLFQMRRGSCERLQFSIGGKIVTIQQMAESVILVSKQVPICYCVNASLAYILSSINKLTGNGTLPNFSWANNS